MAGGGGTLPVFEAPIHQALLATCHLGLILSPIFLIKNLRVRKFKLFGQGHSASEGESQDSGQVGLTPSSSF